MAELLRYIKSDLYKLYHSSFLLIHLIFPICGAVMTLIYAIFAHVSDINKIAAFFQIISISYPFVISIVCVIVVKQEANAGNCQNILTLPNRTKVIISKLTILLGFSLLSLTLCVMLTIAFIRLVGVSLSFSYLLLIMPTIVLWSSNILIYILHLILAFYFGRNACIGMGAVGSLLSALLQTGLGAGLWFVIPYGFGVRLTEHSLRVSLETGIDLPLEVQSATFFCIGMTCVAIILMIICFNRYTGKISVD